MKDDKFQDLEIKKEDNIKTYEKNNKKNKESYLKTRYHKKRSYSRSKSKEKMKYSRNHSRSISEESYGKKIEIESREKKMKNIKKSNLKRSCYSSDSSKSKNLLKRRSRSRSISYNSFKKRREIKNKSEKNKYNRSSSSNENYKIEKNRKRKKSRDKSYDSEEFDEKLNRFRYEKLNKINSERRFKELESDKNKGKYIFNKSLLSNIIQENIRNNKKADQEEIERATQKLYELDKEAYNTNKKV